MKYEGREGRFCPEHMADEVAIDQDGEKHREFGFAPVKRATWTSYLGGGQSDT